MFKGHTPDCCRLPLRMTFLMIPILLSLACSLGNLDSSQVVRIKKTLPTITPTGAAVAQSAPPAPAVEQPSAPLANSQAAPAPPVATAAATPIRPAHLPTLTPTPSPLATAVVQVPNQPVDSIAPTLPASFSTPLPVATTTPTPILNANPPAGPPPPSENLPEPPSPPGSPDDAIPTPRPETPGWAFIGIQTSMNENQAYVVGELINNTGAPQQAVEISGTFYDAQGQVIQDGIDTLSYVPIEVIPAGLHVPFELNIESDRPIYRLDLLAKSDPSVEAPRHDFQFANVSQWQDEEGMYCLGGDVQNSGASLQDYLIVFATVYNGQGGLVSFGEYTPTSPEMLEDGQPSPFEMCVDPLDQQVAHYELNALGY